MQISIPPVIPPMTIPLIVLSEGANLFHPVRALKFKNLNEVQVGKAKNANRKEFRNSKRINYESLS